MWPCNRRGRSVETHDIVDVCRSKPRKMSRTIPHVPLLVEFSLKAKSIGSGSKVFWLSKMATHRHTDTL